MSKTARQGVIANDSETSDHTFVVRVRNWCTGHPTAARIIAWASLFWAAVHVYSELDHFLRLGELGKWIAEHWHKLSRRFWDEFPRAFNLKWRLSTQEKDALTAALFFLPMGVASMIQAMIERRPYLDPINTPWKPRRIAIGALDMVLGLALLDILSREGVVTILRLWGVAGAKAPRWLLIVILSIYFPVLMLIGIVVLLTQSLTADWAKSTNKFCRVFSTESWRFFNYIALGFLIYATWLSSRQIGAVLTLCALFTFYFVAWTALQRPLRLTQLVLVIAVLLTAGYLHDGLETLRHFLEMLSFCYFLVAV